MWYEFTVEPDYLKADLHDWQTSQDMREFMTAVATMARRYKRLQVLIAVHASRTIFKIEEHGILDYFKELGKAAAYRIALTADSDELRFSQQYIEALARQQAMNVRSFRDEPTAIDWFRDRRWQLDRRQRQEPREGLERRHHARRRNSTGIHAV